MTTSEIQIWFFIYLIKTISFEIQHDYLVKRITSDSQKFIMIIQLKWLIQHDYSIQTIRSEINMIIRLKKLIKYDYSKTTTQIENDYLIKTITSKIQYGSVNNRQWESIF